MRDNAREIAALLARGDIDALADAVAEQWTYQRSLHPGITTPEIENIMSAGKRAGARAGKALGASGGGCVLLIARAGEAEKLRAAVAPLGQILEFGMDTEGVTLQQTEER
jgi:D-glycero-alpha-D-manno-heptose-7-phosphate kinase